MFLSRTSMTTTTVVFAVFCLVVGAEPKFYHPSVAPSYSRETPYRDKSLIPEAVFGIGHGRSFGEPSEDGHERERPPGHRRDDESREESRPGFRPQLEPEREPEFGEPSKSDGRGLDGRGSTANGRGSAQKPFRGPPPPSPRRGSRESRESSHERTSGDGSRERHTVDPQTRVVGVNMQMIAGVYPRDRRPEFDDLDRRHVPGRFAGPAPTSEDHATSPSTSTFPTSTAGGRANEGAEGSSGKSAAVDKHRSNEKSWQGPPKRTDVEDGFRRNGGDAKRPEQRPSPRPDAHADGRENGADDATPRDRDDEPDNHRRAVGQRRDASAERGGGVARPSAEDVGGRRQQVPPFPEFPAFPGFGFGGFSPFQPDFPTRRGLGDPGRAAGGAWDGPRPAAGRSPWPDRRPDARRPRPHRPAPDQDDATSSIPPRQQRPRHGDDESGNRKDDDDDVRERRRDESDGPADAEDPRRPQRRQGSAESESDRRGDPRSPPSRDVNTPSPKFPLPPTDRLVETERRKKESDASSSSSSTTTSASSSTPIYSTAAWATTSPTTSSPPTPTTMSLPLILAPSRSNFVALPSETLIRQINASDKRAILEKINPQKVKVA